MPAKLREPWEPVKWRVDVADMELLRLLFPGQVNNVVRQVLNAYCANLRRKGFDGRQALPELDGEGS